MAFSGLRTVVAEDINTAIGEAFQIAAGFDGAADLVELLRRSHRIPALFVATPSDSVVRRMGGSVQIRIKFEAWVVVASTSTETRGDAVLDLAHAVRLYLGAKAPKWELACTAPEKVRRDNAYSKKLDEHNGALAVVTWEQDFLFSDYKADLVDLTGIGFTWRPSVEGAEAPDPGAEIEDDVDL